MYRKQAHTEVVRGNTFDSPGTNRRVRPVQLYSVYGRIYENCRLHGTRLVTRFFFFFFCSYDRVPVWSGRWPHSYFRTHVESSTYSISEGYFTVVIYCGEGDGRVAGPNVAADEKSRIRPDATCGAVLSGRHGRATPIRYTCRTRSLCYVPGRPCDIITNDL